MTSRMEFRNYRSSAQLVHCNIHRKRYNHFCTKSALLKTIPFLTNQDSGGTLRFHYLDSLQKAPRPITATHFKKACSAGARSKNSATNHSTFQKKSELFSIGGGHVVPVVNNTTCFSKYKWLLFLLLFSSYFPLLSHSFLK